MVLLVPVGLLCLVVLLVMFLVIRLLICRVGFVCLR